MHVHAEYRKYYVSTFVTRTHIYQQQPPRSDGSICTHCLRARNSLRFFRETVDHLLNIYCPFKTVTRHSTDKPWVTDGFRHLIRQRQRARMVGDVERAKRLRNQVNRAAPKLRRLFYQSKIASIEATSSRDSWKHMKTPLGNSSGGQNEI